jgi:hypothetical protein
MEKWGMCDTDYIRICNAIGFVEAEFVVFAGCDPQRSEKLHEYFAPQRRTQVIEITDPSDRRLTRLPGYREDGRTEAPRYVKDESCTAHVIAIEGEDAMAEVLARNLACAEGGEVLMLPASSREEVDWFWDQQRQWMNADTGLSRASAWDALKCFLQERLGVLSKGLHVSVSFITRGIPYGLFPLECACTHYFSYPLLGVSIVTGMLKSIRPYLRCPAVYLLDPEECGTSEFAALQQAFGRAGYVLRQSYGKEARVHTARNVTQHMPLDFMFFSTHCGELRGRRITERFVGSDDREHTVVYDLVVGFGPAPGKDLIEVLSEKHWVSLDGVDWADAEGKKHIRAGCLIEEYIEMFRRHSKDAEYRQWAIVATSDAGIVKGSDALKLSDSNYMPAFHNVGGYKCPVVFNNACSSWRKFAGAFAYAGASGYIGASCDVPNPLAVEVASKFADRVSQGRAIGMSLYRAQSNFVRDLGYTPYLMHGYLFTRLQPPGGRANNVLRLRKEVARQIEGWREHMLSVQTEEVRKNTEEIIEALSAELDSIDQKWGIKEK